MGKRTSQCLTTQLDLEVLAVKHFQFFIFYFTVRAYADTEERIREESDEDYKRGYGEQKVAISA